MTLGAFTPIPAAPARVMLNNLLVAFYGALTFGAVVLVHHGYRLSPGRLSEDTFTAMIALAIMWTISVCCHAFMPKPYNQLFPIMDGVVVAYMMWAWRRRLSHWKVALILTLVADGLVHRGYFESSDHSFESRYRYDLTLNLIYIGQLLCVSSTGIQALLRRAR